MRSTSQTTCAGSSGTTTIDSLTIDGVAQSTAVGPNSVTSVSGPTGANLILNEQTLRRFKVCTSLARYELGEHDEDEAIVFQSFKT